MRVLSIDPASHGCGCAVFTDGLLTAAAYVPNPNEGTSIRSCADLGRAVVEWQNGIGYTNHVDDLVVELPQIYTAGADKNKGDQNKIVLPLAMVDAAIATLLPMARVHQHQPHDWKGNTKKPKKTTGPEYVIKTWVKLRMREGEPERVDWSRSVHHSWDVADAIGVGMYHLGRFKPHKVFARE